MRNSRGKALAAPSPHANLTRLVEAFFGPLTGDGGDDRHLQDYHDALVAERRPERIDEAILLRRHVQCVDRADFIGDIIRDLLRVHAPGALAKLLTPVAPLRNQRERLAAEWAAGDPSARAEVDRLLSLRGLTITAVYAAVFEEHLEVFERLSRLQAQAEGRADLCLRELDRSRERHATLTLKVEEPTK